MLNRNAGKETCFCHCFFSRIFIGVMAIILLPGKLFKIINCAICQKDVRGFTKKIERDKFLNRELAIYITREESILYKSYYSYSYPAQLLPICTRIRSTTSG